MKLNTVYIGVGTNLGDKLSNIRMAYVLIQTSVGEITRKSFIYKTPPWGFKSTAFFYNSVIEVKTFLSSDFLLDALQKIEKKLGKSQELKIGYASRLIDLDIIDFNNQIIDTKRLTVPHSHLSNRNFVLYPLQDVCSNWKHPKSKKKIDELIKLLDADNSITRVIC